VASNFAIGLRFEMNSCNLDKTVPFRKDRDGFFFFKDYIVVGWCLLLEILGSRYRSPKNDRKKQTLAQE